MDELRWALAAPPSVVSGLTCARTQTNLEVYAACRYPAGFNRHLSRSYLEVLSNMSPHEFVDHIFNALTSEELTSLMFHEKWRLKTFMAGWPHEDLKHQSMTEMAKEGFYYTGSDDRVQCAFCQGILYSWEPSEIPWEEHRKHFPACKIAAGRPENRNIAKYAYAYIPGKEETMVTRYAQPDEGGSSPASFFVDSGITKHQPSSPPKSGQDRFDTFENWPLELNSVIPEDLVEAGFHYTGRGDAVFCDTCEITLSRWQEGDDAYMEHIRLSPNCPFLRDSVGEEFVDEVYESVPSNWKISLRDFVSRKRDSSSILESIQNLFIQSEKRLSQQYEQDIKYLFGEEPRPLLRFEEHEVSADALGCKNCELLKNIFVKAENIGLPCGHLIFCTPCADQAKARANKIPGDVKCPIGKCQTVLTGSMRIYQV